jgi:hypothetical protein
MKYIITENRLDKFLDNYLDSWVENKAVTRSSPFIIIAQQAQGDDELWDDYMEHDYLDGRLWVNRDLKRNLMDISNKNEDELKKFLKRWFENKFNVDVEYVE